MKKNIYISIATILCVLFVVKNVNSQTVLPTKTPLCSLITKNLRSGSQDYSEKSEIKVLQKFLINSGYLNSNATGLFGIQTLNAVKKFQAVNNIPTTGIVGPLTREKIKDVSCVVAQVIEPATPVSTTTTNASTSLSIPYYSSNFSDWETNWGKTEVSNNGVITIKATPETNGGQISLKNSVDLTDYTVKTDAIIKQGTVSILVRYVNDDNFLACNFSGRYIEIVQKINGVSSVVAYTSVIEYPYYTFFNENTNLGVSVSGKTIGCTLVGSEPNVSFNKIDSALLKGGVSIQTWVNAKGVSEVIIRKVSIN